MKTLPEILATLNSKIAVHKKEIAKIVEELSIMKKKNSVLDNDAKSMLMKHTMTLVEHKSAISTLSNLLEEIQK